MDHSRLVWWGGPGDPTCSRGGRCARLGLAGGGAIGGRTGRRRNGAAIAAPWLSRADCCVVFSRWCAMRRSFWPGERRRIGCGGGAAAGGWWLLCEGMCRCLPALLALLAWRASPHCPLRLIRASRAGGAAAAPWPPGLQQAGCWCDHTG